MNVVERKSTESLATVDKSFSNSQASRSTSNGGPGNKRFGTSAIVLTVVILLAAIAGWLPRHWRRGELAQATRELALSTVAVVSPIASAPSNPLLLPAEIKSLNETAIHSRANGYVKRWMADIGTAVDAGQLLAEIDTPEVNQDLLRAQSQLAEAEAAFELAKTSAARWARLLKTASVSEQEVAEKNADLSLKEAALAAAKASVRRLEELQGFARITAPFKGVITSRKIEIGELVSANSEKELFRLAQTDTLRVFVRVPQTLAQGLSVGVIADLTFPGQSHPPIPMKLVRTSGVIEPGSRTLLCEFELPNANGEVLSGSYAQVRFRDRKGEARTTLPSNTLILRSEGPQVAVVRSDDVVELRSVELGRDFGATIEILSGVSAADRVVLNPADALFTGMRVRVLPATPPPAKK